jgi:hypothetical protein
VQRERRLARRFGPVGLDDPAARQDADAETVSMSTGFCPLPSRMIEPLPKARSICDSAASIAFDLSLSSMTGPSTSLSDDCDMSGGPYGTGPGDSLGRRSGPECTRFVLKRNGPVGRRNSHAARPLR